MNLVNLGVFDGKSMLANASGPCTTCLLEITSPELPYPERADGGE